jgi:hypothetical protein
MRRRYARKERQWLDTKSLAVWIARTGYPAVTVIAKGTNSKKPNWMQPMKNKTERKQLKPG